MPPRRAKVDPGGTPTLKGGGRTASKHRAYLRLQEQIERERLQEVEDRPGSIEARVAEQRELQATKRRSLLSRLPNPIAALSAFFRNPVSRFWVVCNCGCLFMELLITSLFLTFIFPLVRDFFSY